jgi:hypothetical protein
MSDLDLMLTQLESGVAPAKERVGDAVRSVLETITSRAPGRSVEIRVPPYAAVQAIAGPTHRRGTPRAVVELDARCLLELAVGRLTWSQAVAQGRVHASGERSDLTPFFPVSAQGKVTLT